jgi:hypothetical protein
MLTREERGRGLVIEGQQDYLNKYGHCYRYEDAVEQDAEI